MLEDELLLAVRLQDNRVLVETLDSSRELDTAHQVDGEEDLASLVAIYLAPSDVTVIYGLPDKGVLVVKSDTEYKKMVKKILDKM